MFCERERELESAVEPTRERSRRSCWHSFASSRRYRSENQQSAAITVAALRELIAVWCVSRNRTSSFRVLACVKCKNGDPRPDWLLLKHSRQRRTLLIIARSSSQEAKCEIISTELLNPASSSQSVFYQVFFCLNISTSFFNGIKMEKKLDPTGHY